MRRKKVVVDQKMQNAKRDAGLRVRPFMQHVVITGRAAPPEIIEAGDTVTEMTLVKHAFHQGIRAQKGVEW